MGMHGVHPQHRECLLSPTATHVLCRPHALPAHVRSKCSDATCRLYRGCLLFTARSLAPKEPGDVSVEWRSLAEIVPLQTHRLLFAAWCVCLRAQGVGLSTSQEEGHRL